MLDYTPPWVCRNHYQGQETKLILFLTLQCVMPSLQTIATPAVQPSLRGARWLAWGLPGALEHAVQERVSEEAQEGRRSLGSDRGFKSCRESTTSSICSSSVAESLTATNGFDPPSTPGGAGYALIPVLQMGD